MKKGHQNVRRRRSAAVAGLAAACTTAPAARASIFVGEALDKAADVIALVVLFVVPIIVITLFWLVHILPEKVAEKREHPQKEVIKVLCLLSLFFGGLLWPIAWIMAYSKPVLYRLAYGKDKHDDYYRHLAQDDQQEATVLRDDAARLRGELDALAARGQLPSELKVMRDQLLELESRLPVSGAPAGAG